VKVAATIPRLIDRGDLLAALDRAGARKVTIISAPAGSGKTSLLRAWADRRGDPRRLAVMQVQRDQHDAQQFWLALLEAVRRASGTNSRTEPPAATPGFNGRAMVDRVLSELADHHGRVILVIDDLHELNSPEALAQLARLLTSLPSHVHAMLATRRDLPLRLHQLRLAGELAEIRAADLRFTERETRELLDASGIALSDAGAALLHQRTKGWAAGLRLAVISLAGHPDPERFVAEFSGSDRTVAEYLLAEMLDRQPDDVQQLLLRTSLLDRVNGELADLLTGRLARRGSCWGSRTRMRLWYRWTLSVRGFAITTCSGISCGWSCAARCPRRYRRCIGGPPPGSPTMARWSTPSGTRRRRVTGPTRPGCSPTIPSA
jgi:LuxR family maltose regulon positive regulatory protein